MLASCSMIVWLSIAASTQAPLAPAALPSVDSARQSDAIERFQQEAKRYVLAAGEREARLELNAEPLLHWGNPARNGEDGAVFVWTLAGRPAAIGSMFTFTHGSSGRVITKHAFHSLSESALSAKYDKLLVWSPRTAGVSFQPLTTADPPVSSSRGRLAQMRTLAREFSAKMINLQGETSELRLLSQPIFRYEPKSGVASDGAIFAFAIGTDPEALLILEARTTDSAAHWEYAFARFHFVELQAFHDGKQVWRAEPDAELAHAVFGGEAHRNKPYISVAKP